MINLRLELMCVITKYETGSIRYHDQKCGDVCVFLSDYRVRIMSDETGTMSASPSTALHSRHPRHIKLNEQQLESISRDDLLRNWRELDSYVDMLESKTSNQEGSFVFSLLCIDNSLK
jgi:hypothetical protein